MISASARQFSWRRLVVAALPLLAIAMLFAFEIPICPTRNLLGIPCPGCGLTRASVALFTGDLRAMWHFHPLAPVLTPLVVFVVGRGMLVHAGAIEGGKDPLASVPRAWWIVLAAALIGVWLARFGGWFGGFPDSIDPAQGWIVRATRFAVEIHRH